ncbi:hypothetical protein H257_02922 [Aphanomyces astaci]|uniref:HTH CENPB-type domain-containing protein n=1 Tax=Aphanomyces astaci TaxID=112090 RepID=W4GZ95_APHAT|nr:hypothetical protein H257_02922 [Aphanomyces astaci]ETV85045.1 hypothetical protein H257_02922 [Aphanomyces astaci]|eukprot:XP_009825063.1 hypothetical protein H257_02922 [Aphanomyces astaci]
MEGNDPVTEVGTTATEAKSHKRARRETSLVEKLQLIHRADSGSVSQRKLAKDFNIGLGTVNNILKKKANTLLEAHEGAPRETKVRKKPRHEVVDQLVFEWLKCVKGPHLTGNMVKDKALELAKRMPNTDHFKASNGWLESFCKRHDISFRKLRKESSSAATTVPTLDAMVPDSGFDEWTQWFGSMSSVLGLYAADDIYSCSETQLLYQTLPDTAARLLKDLKTHNLSLHEDTEVATLLLCCNMSGSHKLPPLVVGCDHPSTLCQPQDDVGFKRAPQAWMTADIFHEWLLALDLSLKRKVLLILPSTPCHSSDLDLEHVSLRVCPSFLPSQLSPLLQGVVGHFKDAYRGLLLRHVLAMAHLKKDALTVTVDSHRLHAWIVAAWATVTATHCQHSFGRQSAALSAPSTELQSLLALFHVLFPVSDPSLLLSSVEYVNFDDHLPTQLMFTEDFLARDVREPTTDLSDAKAYTHLEELREFAITKQLPALVTSVSQAILALEQRTTDNLIQSIGLAQTSYTWDDHDG